MDLVNELQISAERDDVLTVLRKAKRLASKLDRQDISAWLQFEQAGYTEKNTIPEYRKITTTLAFNTIGYVPAGFGYLMTGLQRLPQFRDICPELPLPDSISNVVRMIDSIANGNEIVLPIEAGSKYDVAVRRMSGIHPMISANVVFVLCQNPSQICSIPDQIKDKVLDWACALERAGVTGKGMSFSNEEKRLADSITFNIVGSNIEQLNNMGMNQKG